MLTSVWLITEVPSSSVTERLSSRSAASPVLARWMRPAPFLSADSKASSDTISEAMRRADAVQSAKRG
jgi:hypothetical protein